MCVHRGKAESYLVFMVNFVQVLVVPRLVQQPVAEVEGQVLKDHAKQTLSCEFQRPGDFLDRVRMGIVQNAAADKNVDEIRPAWVAYTSIHQVYR